MNIKEDLLTVNIFSRPGRTLSAYLGLVWHWVANAGTTAKQNRDYFEKQMYEGRYCGAHYIINLDGAILRCIPDRELAYHCGAHQYKQDAIDRFGAYPNATTLAIEMCHPDQTGKPTGETFDSLIKLSAMLCHKYGWQPCRNIARHYDITGKICPRYFTDDEDVYQDALGRVAAEMTRIKLTEWGT